MIFSMEPAPASFGLGTIGQIAVTVADVSRAIAFYRDKLGIRMLFEVSNMGFFDCGGVRLMLSTAEKPAESYSSVLYFKVADIDAAYSALRSRDVAFEGEPHLIAKMPDHELWMAFFRDPDRNLLALMCERR
jgi:methylmalonyl-CoA/ethylmalonyl-CoA epimerase